MKPQKCALCETEIQTTFLDKILGTIITINGTKHYICPECQKKHKKDLKNQLSDK